MGEIRFHKKSIIILGTVGTLGIFTLLFSLTGLDGTEVFASSHIPSHLSIVSANIYEIEFLPNDVANRHVVFDIQVESTPSCKSDTGFLVYGFLIDSDKNSQTGNTIQAFNDLGVDAQISIFCDPSTQTFSSPLGPVNIFQDSTNVTHLQIITTVGLLPSVDFNWIAFVEEDSLLIRFPGSGFHNHWAIMEILLW